MASAHTCLLLWLLLELLLPLPFLLLVFFPGLGSPPTAAAASADVCSTACWKPSSWRAFTASDSRSRLLASRPCCLE